MATYTGPIPHLKGKTAIILQTAVPGYIAAQFDDRNLTRSGFPIQKVLDYEPHARFPTWVESAEPPVDALGFGWHAFPAEHFE